MWIGQIMSYKTWKKVVFFLQTQLKTINLDDWIRDSYDTHVQFLYELFINGI